MFLSMKTDFFLWFLYNSYLPISTAENLIGTYQKLTLLNLEKREFLFKTTTNLAVFMRISI